MDAPDKRLVTVRSVSHDWEAALLVAALVEHDIRAVTTGEFTSEFRAEAPGLVKVQVLSEDRERADEILRECFSMPDPEEEAQEAALYTMGWSSSGWIQFFKYTAIVGLLAELAWLANWVVHLIIRTSIDE